MDVRKDQTECACPVSDSARPIRGSNLDRWWSPARAGPDAGPFQGVIHRVGLRVDSDAAWAAGYRAARLRASLGRLSCGPGAGRVDPLGQPAAAEQQKQTSLPRPLGESETVLIFDGSL